MSLNTSDKVTGKTVNPPTKSSLKYGPVIFQSEELPTDQDRAKKDLTLSELNQVFKMYLQARGSHKRDISIIGQFSVIYNDPNFGVWHTLSKSAQSDSLSEQVIMPPVYGDLITPIGTTAGDPQIIKGVVKDAVQNAIDSFSHAAFLQRKYGTRFPGIKIILFIDQLNKRMVLAVVDNGFGANITKPKKSFTGEEYGNDFASRLVDWAVRRFVEKDEGEVRHDIA